MNGNEIGERIAALRKQFGMSKRAMAEMLQVSYSAACSWEYGLRVPSDEMKVKIANLFGTSVEAIFYSGKYHET